MKHALISAKMMAINKQKTHGIFQATRLLILALVPMAMLSGCEEDQEAVQPMNTGPRDVEIVSGFINDLQARDSTAVFNRMTDQTVVTVKMNAQGTLDPIVFNGRTASEGYLRNIFRLFSQVRFTDIALTAGESETVFVEMNGDFITTAGARPYRNVYVFKFQLQQGRVVGITEYFNPITAAVLQGRPVGPCNTVLCQQ